MESIKPAAERLCQQFIDTLKAHGGDGYPQTIDAIQRLFASIPGAEVEQFDSGGDLKIVVARWPSASGEPLFATADDTSISVYEAAKLGADLTSCYDAWYDLCGEDREILVASACLG